MTNYKYPSNVFLSSGVYKATYTTPLGNGRGLFCNIIRVDDNSFVSPEMNLDLSIISGYNGPEPYSLPEELFEL